MSFIASQIIQFIAYALLIYVTHSKTKKEIMWLLVVFNVLMVAAFILLGNSQSGVIVSVLMAIKCMMEYLHTKKLIHKKVVLVVDIFVYIGLAVGSYYTYNGFGSLLSIIATVLYLTTASSKSVLVVKIGIFLSTAGWLLYNWYVGSPVGVAIECVVVTSSFIGILNEIKNNKENNVNPKRKLKK